MSIGDAFDAAVDYYDDWMRRALPGYDDLFATATSLIPYKSDRPIEVLDLGAGTGLFSKHVLDAFPNARFTLVDLAEKLLDVARQRFAARPAQFRYLTADYRTIEPSPQVDVVISSLSIHHLTDEEKQDLFRRVFRLVRDGGVFLNLDQIRGESPEMEDLYRTRWLEYVRRQGATEQQISESLERRRTYDHDALLGEQLEWLRAAGFASADCVSKNWFVGVFLAVRSSRRRLGGVGAVSRPLSASVAEVRCRPVSSRHGQPVPCRCRARSAPRPPRADRGRVGAPGGAAEPHPRPVHGADEARYGAHPADGSDH